MEFQGYNQQTRNNVFKGKNKLAINVNGKEILFDNIDELKEYVDDLYR